MSPTFEECTRLPRNHGSNRVEKRAVRRMRPKTKAAHLNTGAPLLPLRKAWPRQDTAAVRLRIMYSRAWYMKASRRVRAVDCSKPS